MAQLPGNGIYYAWGDGFSGYGLEMDDNLKKINTLINSGIIDRDLSTPPGSPSEGDTYIVAATGTGDWVGQDNNIAVYVGAAWYFITPKIGTLVYIIDEDVLSAYKAAGWSVGISI